MEDLYWRGLPVMLMGRIPTHWCSSLIPLAASFGQRPTSNRAMPILCNKPPTADTWWADLLLTAIPHWSLSSIPAVIPFGRKHLARHALRAVPLPFSRLSREDTLLLVSLDLSATVLRPGTWLW